MLILKFTGGDDRAPGKKKYNVPGKLCKNSTQLPERCFYNKRYMPHETMFDKQDICKTNKMGKK